VRTQRLFKIVRDRVHSPADVFALIEDLEGRAELSRLGDPGHGYWISPAGAPARSRAEPLSGEADDAALRGVGTALERRFAGFG
jgi:hypothetical protein